MRSYYLLIILSLLCFSCQSDKERRQETIKAINVDFKLIRFDSIFMSTRPQNLLKLKTEYPQFFPENTPDSLWINKRQDSLMQIIYKEVKQKYPTTDSLKNQLEKLFKHYHYYFPQVEIPDVYTVAEYVDYRHKIVKKGDNLVISLDNYLGKDHRFYSGFEDYIANLQTRDQLLPDVVNTLSDGIIFTKKDRSFVAQMINYGKTLYLKDKLIPFVKEHQRLGYREGQFKWAKSNEKQIWRYFIENELIFSTEKSLLNRFLFNAPFSKFYLKFDKDSPPRLGRFIGREIIKSYADKHPDKSLKDIMLMPAEKIYKASNYKPD